MIPPRVNQLVQVFQTVATSRKGDKVASEPVGMMVRLTEGQTTDYSFRGNEATYDAAMHCKPTNLIKEGAVLKYKDTIYTIEKVIKTNGLNGKELMYYCKLNIEAGVAIV